MLISFDIGTTNVKAVAFSDRGAIWGTAERRNHVLTPKPDRSEQDPQAILENMRAVLKEVLAEAGDGERLEGLVFSSAMHGLLAVDKVGKPLTNIWLWSDLRAAAIAKTLRQSKTGRDIYRRTGVPIHPMSPLLKILWMRENEPKIFQRTHKFLAIKDYLLFHLLGEYVSDLAIASATGLLNIRKNKWDPAAMELAGISSEQLPGLAKPTQKKQILAKVTANLGLPEGLPLILGGSDGALANLGSNATSSGQWAVTIGTSAAIRMVTNQPFTDPQMRSFCYRLDENRCIVGGASNNGTNALEWLRTEVMKSRLSVGAFAKLAHEAPAGADGLLFFPYLLGERAPLWDAQAQGSFRGIKGNHGQAHFIRAVMEGILFNLKVIAEPLEAVQPLEVLHAGGGFSHSPLWVQMLADIFQKPVHLDQAGADSSVLGALLVGRQGMGFPAPNTRRKEKIIKPDKSKAAIYTEAFTRFLDMCRKP